MSSASDKSTLLEVVSLLEVAIFCPFKVAIHFRDYPIGIRDPFSQAHFGENTDISRSLEALLVIQLMRQQPTHGSAMAKSTMVSYCLRRSAHLQGMCSETSLICTSEFLVEQICNNPTVHYTIAPSFIQFPHFICNFIQNKMCVHK